MTGGSLFDRFESLSLGWCDWMFQISWQVALLVVVLAVVTRILRQRSAVLLHALWLLVLLRLVIPPDFSLPTGWGWWFLPPRSTHVPAGPVADPGLSKTLRGSSTDGTSPEQGGARSVKMEVADSSPPSPLLVPETQTKGSSFETDAPPPEHPPDESRSVSRPALWAGYLMLAWMGVSGTLLALLGIGTVRIWKWVYDAEPIDDAELYRLLEGCRRQLGMTRLVELRNSDACTTPVVVGYSRPVILLPRAVLLRLNDDELRAVLLHELNHVVRGDAIVNLLQGVLGALYFFHPLVWWANARLRELREEACDEMTVAALEGRRKIYGEAIVKVTEIFGYASPPLALGVMESKTPAFRRLRRILDPQLPAGRHLNLQEAGLIFLIGIILLPSAGARAPAADGRAIAEAPNDPAFVVRGPDTGAIGGAREAAEKADSATSESLPAKKTDISRDAPPTVVKALKYLWQTDQVISYRVKIDADLGDETETLAGTPFLRVRWADADRAEIVFSGALSSNRIARSGPPIQFPPRFPRHAFSSFGGSGGMPFASEHTIQMDHFGRPREVRGDSQLPYILGNLSQLLIVPLPNPPAETWDDATKSVLTLYPPEDRFSRPRLGPFARRQPEEQLNAREVSHYTLEVDSTGPLIRRKYELKSNELVEGEPRLALTGEFRIRFDADRGIATGIDGRLQHVQNSPRSTIRIPIEISAAILPEQPVTPIPIAGVSRGPGFNLPESRSESSGEHPESPPLPTDTEKLPLDSAAIDEILKSLSSGDASQIRKGAELLCRAVPGERRRDVAHALGECLVGEDEPARAAAAAALADWGTIAESPRLIAALADKSHNVVRGAIDALGRLRDPSAIDPLVDLIRERRERSHAAAALRNIGRPAEPAVATLLNDSDWSIRLDACRILQVVGTAQTADEIERLAAADPNILVRRAAHEALEQTRASTAGPTGKNNEN